MRLLFKSFMLIAGACLCFGCASVKDSTAKAYNKALVFMHIRGDSTADKEAEPHVCLLDPASMIPQESSELATDSVGGPCLEVSETEYDFGSLKQEEDYIHQFKVKNVGKTVLNIKKVLPG